MSGDNAMSVQQAQQLEQMKRQLLTTMLSKEAFERLGRVRTVNPGLAGQAELYLLQLYQTGRLKQKITDEKMREVLNVLSNSTGFNIKRK
jgi:programmed cell death protein 5